MLFRSISKQKEYVFLGNKQVGQLLSLTVPPVVNGCGFNADALGADEAADPTSDGLLIARFNRGLAGAALVAGARLDQTPANLPNTSANVSAHMDAYARAHDVDGNESVNLTDALIITRYLAGFRGTALTSGLTLSGTRTNSSAIEAYIAQDCPNNASTNALTYLHPNVSGSPLMATDAFGNALWREDYLAFGEKTKYEASVNQNQNFFIGKPTDATTGLVYFGARWYDPAVARFLSFDPAEVDDANPHSFNRYSYGNNNPHKFLDPDGRAAIAAMGVMGRQAAAAQTLGSTTLSNPGAPQLDPSTGIMSNPGQSASAAYIGGFLSHVSAVATMFTPIHVMEVMAGIITANIFGTRNGHLAGSKHAVTGIPFDKSGYPDFSGVARADVTIGLTGSNAGDFRAANIAAGLKRTPENFTWHHHQDVGRMQLVPTDVHSKTGHTGGVKNSQEE